MAATLAGGLFTSDAQARGGGGGHVGGFGGHIGGMHIRGGLGGQPLRWNPHERFRARNPQSSPPFW